VSLEDARRQKTDQPELSPRKKGEAQKTQRSGEASTAAHDNERSGTDHLMEQVVDASNVQEALKKVVQNKGSPGVDGMRTEDLQNWLAGNWEKLREELLTGRYQPGMVRRHAIPKSGGGVRELGIPTALDRMIQQAILQVLQPRFDPTFSEHSYGFRPGRRAHDALRAAQAMIQGGRQWVVDADLEKMFDRVNHDVLMGRLEKRIADKRLLRLIRRYLEAGVMADGVVMERHEGTPQGGPLSPLLANVLLDEVDRELERRGHAFCRYADDLNVYVGSKRAGEDVLALLRRLYGGLRLKINEAKSAVARPWDRQFLGYSFTLARRGKVKLCVAPKALAKMKERVREITSRMGGRSMRQVAGALREYLPGWKSYFQLAEPKRLFDDLDEWIRRRLRVLQLKQWKRGTTVFDRLRARGISHGIALTVAGQCEHYARLVRSPVIYIALPNRIFDDLGVPRLAR
jgi:group II intron reverse transcriptase/maturase